MKVFIRAGTMAEDHPQVIATYGDDIEIADDAHGPGVHVLYNVPQDALEHLPGNDDPSMPNPIPTLRKNWREFSKKTWTRDQKLHAVFEVLTMVISYGSDKSKWPPEKRDRLLEISRHFKETP